MTHDTLVDTLLSIRKRACLRFDSHTSMGALMIVRAVDECLLRAEWTNIWQLYESLGRQYRREKAELQRYLKGDRRGTHE